MTNLEFIKRIKELADIQGSVNRINKMITEFEADIDIRKAKSDLEELRWMNLRNRILLEIMRLTPHNDKLMLEDDFWSIAEKVIIRVRIPQKRREKVDSLFLGVSTILENK